MLFIIVLTIFMAAIAGLIVKLVLDYFRKDQEISWLEFGIGMAIICIILVPGTASIGWHMARTNLVTFNEYWNGWETRVIKEDQKCERDGWCSYEYDCDPYIVMVPYSCNCDKNNNCSTCYRPETRYHSCPYVTVESHYYVDTTLGRFTIDTHRFPEDPQNHRWRKSERIPQSVIDRAGVGPHPFWLAAKTRLDNNDPGPVTKRMTYENYILASDRTIMKAYSKHISEYEQAGLLPKVSKDVHDFYLADKVYFVGLPENNIGAWRSAASKLNAGLGTELQGDLHIVVVRNDTVNANPDLYPLVLKAYWQDISRFGEDAFAKNGIGIILGTADGQTVAWARAFTGMPIGNEEMLLAMQNQLKGIALNPTAVFGSIQGKLSSLSQGKPAMLSDRSQGVLNDILLGQNDKELRFKRYSMKSKDPDDIGGGYLYLYGEIQPTPWQKFWIGFISFFLSGFVWVACAFIGVRDGSGYEVKEYIDRWIKDIRRKIGYDGSN